MKKRDVMQKLLQLTGEECGSALVEFALTILLLMSVTVGVIGFALAMYTYHFVSSAAQQGLRFAIVRGDTWSEYTPTTCSTSAPASFTMVYDCTASATDIQNYVQSTTTGGIDPDGVGVTTAVTNPSDIPGDTVTGCSATDNNKGCIVKVTVSYTFDFIPFQHLSAFTMSATSAGVTVQ